MMSGMKRIESVTVPDGEFSLHVWTPESGRGPGILLLQEIFGVGDYLQEVGEELAGMGYVAAAPDVFWRIEKDWSVRGDDEQALQKGMGMLSQYDWAKCPEDLAAALGSLKALPEVEGKVGVLGFCFGGHLAYLLAAQDAPDAMVSFYGGGVPDALDQMDGITCPAQFHFGGSDDFIPRDKVAAVERAVQERPNAEIHVQEDGGHAFHNRKSPIFYQPEPAARAWRLTEAFLARHLPVA